MVRRLLLVFSISAIVLGFYLVILPDSDLLDAFNSDRYLSIPPIARPRRPDADNRTTTDGSLDQRLVLAWTTYFGANWTAIDQLFDSSIIGCSIVHDRSMIDRASAVLFHMRSFSWNDLPPTRWIDQYYVFVLSESPVNTNVNFGDARFRDYFNLTMTYRHDSDIVAPYGDFEPIDNRSDQSSDYVVDFRAHSMIDNDSLASNYIHPTRSRFESVFPAKTRPIAWLVSNCKTASQREKVVARIRRYMAVDIFGHCGKLECSKDTTNGWNRGPHDSPACNRLLTRSYKFYLAFENSLCRDYVTEKFYFTLDNSLIIPIVLERRLISDTFPKDLAPNLDFEILNRAFIAVDDFESIGKLVQYLEYLDRNLTAYLEYFEWRKYFRVILEDKYPKKPGVELCAILKSKSTKIVRDLKKWWVKDARCHKFGSKFL